MRNLIIPVILICMTLPGRLLAAPADLQQLLGGETRFLPVEEAFRPSVAQPAPGMMALYFDIAPDYYLYRERFTIVPQGDVQLGDPIFPDGVVKEDEYFGRTEVYYEQVEIQLPFRADSPAPPRLRVRYQGCAEAGLCYPPQWVTLELGSAGPVADTPPSTGTPQATESVLFAGGFLQTLALFFLAGLGLTFTPCVLPMVPILSSVIVGQGERLTTRRSAVLSLSYVAGMAVSFAAAGLLVGHFGARLNLQMHMQNPWVLGSFALLFAVLALSMFDVYQLRLPNVLAARLAPHSGNHRGVLSAAGMGMISSLVVSPCVTAPLAGALLYISATGDALLGGSALLALGVGMGVPLLLVGIGGGRFVPRAGHWMNRVKQAFGVGLLGVAIWMLERVTPGPVILLMWAGLLILCAVGLGALDRSPASGWAIAGRSTGIFALVYAVLLMLGAASGGTDPLRPLASFGLQTASQARGNVAREMGFIPVSNLTQLREALTNSGGDTRPVMLDIYADWCISCQVIENQVFADPEVRRTLNQFRLLRADVTASNSQHIELMEHFGIFGPPGLLFFAPDGEELREVRVQGEITAGSLLDRLRSIPFPGKGDTATRTPAGLIPADDAI